MEVWSRTWNGGASIKKKVRWVANVSRGSPDLNFSDGQGGGRDKNFGDQGDGNRNGKEVGGHKGEALGEGGPVHKGEGEAQDGLRIVTFLRKKELEGRIMIMRR